MYIIVVGGGKVGYYLTKTLLNEGHEVLLIERDLGKVDIYNERFGSVVIGGDGAEASTLANAYFVMQKSSPTRAFTVDRARFIQNSSKPGLPVPQLSTRLSTAMRM